MYDVIGEKIKPGLIVAFASKRQPSSGLHVMFGIVYTCEPSASGRVAVKAIEADSIHAKAYTVRTSLCHVNPTQLWVIDPSTLPKALVSKLQKAYALHVSTLKHADKNKASKEAYLALSPAERMKHNVKQAKELGLYNKYQR